MKTFSQALAGALEAWPGDFSLAVVGTRGNPDAGGSVEELRVDGAGRGEFECTSLPQGSSGPVGRFSGQVPKAEVRALAELLARVDFASLTGGVPAGGDPTIVELTAGGQGVAFAIEALTGAPEALDALNAFANRAAESLTAQPHAALRLELARDGARLKLVLRKLGKAPLLVGNPLAKTGTRDALLKLHLATGKDSAGDPTWESFDVPLAGSPFEGAGRRLPLDKDLTVTFDDPSGGASATALAVRATLVDPDRPPARRLGGLDVFVGPAPSNALEPTEKP